MKTWTTIRKDDIVIHALVKKGTAVQQDTRLCPGVLVMVLTVQVKIWHIAVKELVRIDV